MKIRMENVVKRFGALEAVSNVTLEIEDGELFTLLGPSGCGKTTLLRLVGGFHQPDRGEIFFGSKAVSRVPPYERNIGVVFQNYALWPHMTIYENVAYGLKIKKFSKKEIDEKVRQALEMTNLTGLENRYPGQVSGGQQQRAALARALVLSPDVLLLDEPLSNLDAKIRIQVRAEIRKLQKDLGITTIYVTHDQEEALTISDRIAVMNQGRVQQIGVPQELYERPKNPFVADFIGINNLIPGRVRGLLEDGRLIEVETKVGFMKVENAGGLKTGDPCIVCVRPETASLEMKEISDKEMNGIRGTVNFVSYIGNAVRYDIDLGNGNFFKVDVQNPWNHKALAIGAKVWIYFPQKVSLGIGQSWENRETRA
jgi:iron(III) transport system ATP-binding protein